MKKLDKKAKSKSGAEGAMRSNGKLSTAPATRRRIQELYPESPTGKASNYLYRLEDHHREHPDMRAVIYCRVSAGMQGYKGNLYTYMRLLRIELKQRNIPVIGCWHEVNSGWILDEDRYALMNAVEQAKKYGAVIVAPSSDRYLRNIDFHTKERPDIIPTVADFDRLKELTGYVPLLTLLDPDMPPQEVRGYQTRWGQQNKRSKGGRPRMKVAGYKKRLRQQKHDIVLRLHRKGKRVSDISFKTGIKRSTVNDWISKHSRQIKT